MNRVIAASAAGVLLLLFFGYFGYRHFSLSAMPEPDLFSACQISANKHNYEKAVDCYRALLRKSPKHTTAMEFMAECQVQLQQVKEAIATYENLVKLDRSPRLKTRLAALYKQTGQSEKARMVAPVVVAPAKTSSHP